MREREFTKTRVLMTNERTLAERAAGLADEALRRRAEGRRAKGCAPLVARATVSKSHQTA